jgi:hypothetical protein
MCYDKNDFDTSDYYYCYYCGGGCNDGVEEDN